jgi:hypothetical protein
MPRKRYLSDASAEPEIPDNDAAYWMNTADRQGTIPETHFLKRFDVWVSILRNDDTDILQFSSEDIARCTAAPHTCS